MAYLCGRPGCSEEAAATLQIDAVAETVSLVDARVSRDGVPLCSRHADITTPPMGWAMNDLRSNAVGRPLAAVPDPREVPRSTPPRVRPERTVGPAPVGRPQTRRPRPVDGPNDNPVGGRVEPDVAPAGRRGAEAAGNVASEVVGEVRGSRASGTDGKGSETSAGKVGSRAADEARSRRRRPKAVGADRGGAPAADTDSGNPLVSRPSRRRGEDGELLDDGSPSDSFPWHHHFDEDDEAPSELQASSPLLSRAFRSTAG